jgi:two-component system sensor histidine kinase KdpD
MSDQRTTSIEITPLTNTEPDSALQLFKAPFAMRYIAALLMTALATVVAVGIDTKVTIPNLSLVFVIPVVVAAVIFGLGPSFFSAVLGALAFNFFLTEPRYSLNVDDPANIWAIALLFVCACIASAVASTARRKADDVALLQRQTEALQSYGRAALTAGSPTAIVSSAANALEAIFQVPVVVMILSDAAVVLLEKRGKLEPTEAELDAGRASLTTCGPVPANVYPFDTSRFDFWPVPARVGQQAVVGLAFDPDERPRTPGILVETVASILALALARQPSSPGAASL